MDHPELLVVLRPGSASIGDTSGLDVVHQISPTVMVIRGSAITTPGDADVVYMGTDPPPEVLAELDDNERLFVEAWLANRAAPKTHRPGDGLAWDAEGMTPPDVPPSRPRPPSDAADR